MNATFEPGILSPLSQYLQEGSQQTSMGTPRPGTPRGSHFRLSPDGMNPGTPGAASSYDHHKFPNSPWSGSEPATPGSGYNRNVVPSSPYISSYPNTPATPGSGGFYQKPVNGTSMAPGNGTTTAVPPGSPWTDRSTGVCTPGPLTPMTPATPMHSSSMSDHGSSSSSFGNNGSPTFPMDNQTTSSNSNGKHVPQMTGLAGLLQQDNSDSMLPLSVMNHHSVQTPPSHAPSSQPSQVPTQNGNSGNALALPPISDNDISQAVDSNPNLISEFEAFFKNFLHRKNEEKNMNQNPQQPPPHPNQNQPPQHQPPPPLQQPQHNNNMHNMMNHGDMSNGGNMMYSNNPMHNGNNGQQGGMMLNNAHHMTSMQMGSSVGPMRTNKFHPQNHGGHPYMMQNGNNGGNGLMARARQVPGHFNGQHNIQYGNLPPPQGVPHHHHRNLNMANNMNMMGQVQPGRQPQYGMQGQTNTSASVYSPSPSGSNGVYVQVLPPNHNHPQHNTNMGAPPTYPSVQQPSNNMPVQWQQNPVPQQPQHPPLNNHNQNLGMMNGPNNGVMPNSSRGIPQQPNQYFQNPVNSVNGGMEQGLSNGNSVLPPTTYPFDLNNGGNGPPSVGGGTNNLAMNPGTSAIQGPSGAVQSPLSMNMGSMTPLTPNPATPLSDEALNIDLDGPYDGSTLPQATWTKALDKASRQNPVAEVGKVLFDDIFTDDEVIHCTLSGRGSTKKFNPNKVNFLKKAVAWLMSRPTRPWEFNPSTCDLTLGQDDESGVLGLEKKVFTEYRSRRRGDILKTRPTPPPGTS